MVGDQILPELESCISAQLMLVSTRAGHIDDNVQSPRKLTAAVAFKVKTGWQPPFGEMVHKGKPE
jgi:hypothetical protein